MLTPRTGRILSAAGAVVLALALFLTWYHIDRSTPADPDTTGWQTFFRLRVAILVGAVLVLVSALVRQTRPVLVGRTLLGLVLAALIVRRIVDPPDLVDPVTPQLGVYVGALGALAVAIGGLVDSGREVVGQYPDLAFWRAPAAELPAWPDDGGRSEPDAPRHPAPGGDVVNSTAEEVP